MVERRPSPSPDQDPAATGAVDPNQLPSNDPNTAPAGAVDPNAQPAPANTTGTLPPGDPGAYPLPGSFAPGTTQAIPMSARRPQPAPAGAPAPRPLPPQRRAGQPAPAPQPGGNGNRTPSNPNQRSGRGWKIATAIGVTAAVLAGGYIAEKKYETFSKDIPGAAQALGNWITGGDDEEPKPEKEVKPGGPIFEPTAEKRVELYDGPKEDPYNWGPGFNLTADNVEEAVKNLNERAYYSPDIAAVMAAELGYDGHEGKLDAPEKHEFTSDYAYQQAVRGYADALNADRAGAEKVVAWISDEMNNAFKDGKLSVEHHNGNSKVWGKELGPGGRVYLEDSAWGNSKVLIKVNADGSKTCFRADCGWQPYEEIAVQVSYAAPATFQPAAATSIPAAAEAAPQGESAVQWGPQAETLPPADTPDTPGTPPPTSPLPSSPPSSSLPPSSPPLDAKNLLEDFNANLQAINPWGDSKMPAPNKVTPLAPLPDTYKAPAAPKVDNGDSSTGGFSGPKIDSNLGNGTGGSTKAPGIDNNLNSGMTDLS